MLDGKMEDDASLKQCLVMVRLAEQLAAIDALDTGVRGGPEPEDVTRENYGIDIPEA